MDTSPRPAPSSLREATRPGDLGAVVALHGVLYTDEYGMDGTMEALAAQQIAELVLTWHSEGTYDAGKMWVAELDGRVVGAVAMVRGDAPDGWGRLRWVILHPDARGRGIGRALFERAMTEARDRGYAGVYLWTIAGLDAAHHLYKSAGFRVTHSEPTRTWGIDAIEQRMELPFA
ncbi:GNAT family N-acetyltransferase [Yinghuangia seranimata]|uniref:GNAT family N-acetyltransferase n=1 Tax=Yinghuangia seranimata TaxID=408067 RepID=UPI00248BDA3A|nr:GNAT family N-acetyltransferase [Yinghuangia seranimata]MDI2127208.1 GNAT family N-acetyltransferase [Yinghuangia seranimata]